MAIAVFNWSTSTANPATGTPETAWSLLFPELAYIGQSAAQNYFLTAGMFCDNTGSGQVVAGAPYYQLDLFLDYIAAHLAKLFSPSASGSAASPLVGRISDATQGSVSVAAALVNNPSDQMAFFAQTQYGLFYWTMSAQFRTGFYVPPPCGAGGPGIYGVFPSGPGYLNPWAPPDFG